MRVSFVQALLKYTDNTKVFLLAGDLGYNALEPLEKELGNRFCNAGIAEQNMLGLAAGFANEGLLPFVYSISPFLYARAFEQLRNDICFHNLPVCLVGSGAGFGYGISGSSHHALDDCALLSTLPHLDVHAPCFAKDLDSIIDSYFKNPRPTYIRLARHESISHDFPEYKPYRKLLAGEKGLLIILGSMSGVFYDYYTKLNQDERPNLWCCSKLPVFNSDIPKELLEEINISDKLCLVEDHIKHGGFGEQFLYKCLVNKISIGEIKHAHALSTYSSIYGSQDYLREMSGLSIKNVNKFLLNTNEIDISN